MPDSGISRRDFLKLAGITLLSACTPKPLQEALEPGTSYKPKEAVPIIPDQDSEVNMSLGEEVKVNTQNLKWIPDTRTSMIVEGDIIKLFVAAGTEGYLLEGRSFDNLTKGTKVISPERNYSDFGYNGYRAPGAVIRGAEDGQLLCFYHEEHWSSEHSGFPFTARVGIAVSEDGGYNWEVMGVVIDGADPVKPAGERVSGAGQPSVIVVDNEAYLYYIDWDKSPHAIHAAKAPLDSVSNKESWKQISGGKAVITPPEGEVYTALPCVTWNSHINKYLAVFETNTGFWVATSSDAINWGGYEKILSFPQPHSSRKQGDTWYSYPTILSETTGEQLVTGQKGWLIYSRGVEGVEAHQMVRRPFNLG